MNTLLLVVGRSTQKISRARKDQNNTTSNTPPPPAQYTCSTNVHITNRRDRVLDHKTVLNEIKIT